MIRYRRGSRKDGGNLARDGLAGSGAMGFFGGVRLDGRERKKRRAQQSAKRMQMTRLSKSLQTLSTTCGPHADTQSGYDRPAACPRARA